MISREVPNYVISSDYTDRMKFGISLDILFRYLIDTQKVLHTYSVRNWISPKSVSWRQNNQLSRVQILLLQRWLPNNRKLVFHIMELKTKWLYEENNLSVKCRFTPNKPLKYISLKSESSSILSVTFTHVYLSIDLSWLSTLCKRVIWFYCLCDLQFYFLCYHQKISERCLLCFQFLLLLCLVLSNLFFL